MSGRSLLGWANQTTTQASPSELDRAASIARATRTTFEPTGDHHFGTVDLAARRLVVGSLTLTSDHVSGSERSRHKKHDDRSSIHQARQLRGQQPAGRIAGRPEAATDPRRSTPRYFSDKLELLIALSWDAASVMTPLFTEFAGFKSPVDRSAIHDWLQRFLAAQRRFSGVTRTWTEGFPIDAARLAPAANVVEAINEAIQATFGPPRPYPLDRQAGGMLLSSLLEHFPDEGLGTKHEPTPAQIIDAQLQFIERALLPRGRPAR